MSEIEQGNEADGFQGLKLKFSVMPIEIGD